MNRGKLRPTKIAILEGFWNDDAEHRLTIDPLFKLLARRDQVRYVLLHSSTVEEFRFNLDVTRTVRGGGVLVLAFHGFKKGGFYLTTGKVTMEDVALWLGKDFGKKKEWIVFFHSCQTLDVDRARIEEFMANTGVRTVIGYTKKVDFMEAAAVGLLLLDWLQFYVNIPRLWKRFQKHYPDLVKMTGLTIFFNGHRT